MDLESAAILEIDLSAGRLFLAISDQKSLKDAL
jgi:hypothetical protein